MKSRSFLSNGPWLIVAAVSILAGEIYGADSDKAVASAPMSADACYVTALTEYQLAELAWQQGHVTDAKRSVAAAMQARDLAIDAYLPQATDIKIAQRIATLRNLDYTCCGKQSLSQRIKSSADR